MHARAYTSFEASAFISILGLDNSDNPKGGHNNASLQSTTKRDNFNFSAQKVSKVIQEFELLNLHTD